MTQTFEMYVLDESGRRDEAIRGLEEFYGRENLERNSAQFEFESENSLTTFAGWLDLRRWIVQGDEEVVLYLDQESDEGSYVLGFGADGSATHGLLTAEMNLNRAVGLFSRLVGKFDADSGLIADICTPLLGREEFTEAMGGDHYLVFRRHLFE